LRKFIKYIVESFSSLFTDYFYFKIIPPLHILGSDLKRRGGVDFIVLKPNLYEARSRCSRQDSIYFCERSRYQRYLYSDGPHKALQSMLKKYCIQDPSSLDAGVIVDIGANVGEFSIAVAPYAKQVIAFEPDPLVQEALNANLTRFENVIVEPIALSNMSGSVPFYLSTKNADSSFVKPMKYSGIIQVKAQTLDEYIGYKSIDRIDFLKLEAEGWEPEVLEGGKKALYITKEVCVDAGPEREGISTVPEVQAALENAGFDVHCYGNMVLGKK